LEVDDDLHGSEQRLLALLDGIDETLGSIYFLFQEKESIFGFFALVFLVGSMLFQQFIELPTQAQLRYISVVEGETNASVFLGFYQEVGNDLLEILADDISQRASWPWVELGQFVDGFIVCFFADVQALNNLFLVFSGKIIAKLLDDFYLYFL